MRQAGRYQKWYREIRSKVSFLELCHSKELVAEVTIRAANELNVDTAIIFSDLLVMMEPLGFRLEFTKGDGPVITGTINVDKIPEVDPQDSLAYVLDAIRLTRQEMPEDLPLIGFGGAPFTLASYIIEGGGSKDFQRTKAFIAADHGKWHALMDKIVNAQIKFLNAQIDAGADCLQVFDSWVGHLSGAEYETLVLRHSKKLLSGISGRVPVIHFGTGTGDFLDKMREAGGDVIGADFRISLDEAWKKIGYDRGVQGNFYPELLFESKKRIQDEAKKILDQAGGRPGHVFNLGHGILPNTPEENARYLVDTVHELSSQ